MDKLDNSWWDIKWIPQMSSWKTWDKIKDLLYECPDIPTIDKEMLKYWDYMKIFVKWLVDNDKIDLYKVDEIYYQEYWVWGLTYSDDELVIMLLSIQDEPISFLCDILK